MHSDHGPQTHGGQIIPRPDPSRTTEIVKGRGFDFQDSGQLFKWAQTIAGTPLAPKGDKPLDIMAKVQYGYEIGVAPQVALKCIANINGRMCVWGDLFLALCKDHPQWDESGFEEFMEGEPFTDQWTAVCRMKRKDGKVREGRFSVAMAKRAGLWQDKPSPAPWYRYPQRMLQMRARSPLGKDLFPEKSMGLMTREEAEDMARLDREAAATAKPAGSRTMAALGVAPTQVDPPTETTTTDDTIDAEAVVNVPDDDAPFDPADIDDPALGAVETEPWWASMRDYAHLWADANDQTPPDDIDIDWALERAAERFGLPKLADEWTPEQMERLQSAVSASTMRWAAAMKDRPDDWTPKGGA